LKKNVKKKSRRITSQVVQWMRITSTKERLISNFISVSK